MSETPLEDPISIIEFKSSKPLILAKEDVDYIKKNIQEGEGKKMDLDQQDGFYIITAKNFVGTIPLKHSKYPQISITPKAGQVNFIQMWGYTESIDTAKLFENVNIQYGNSLADLMVKPFLGIVEPIIQEGIYKNYVTVIEQIPGVKGRLLLSQNIRSSHITHEKFWCEFDERTADILENQILLYCAKLLSTRIISIDFKKELYYFQHRLEIEGVSDVSIEPYHLDLISLQKHNYHYKNALDFCELILRYFGYGFQKGGMIPGSGHLYDMNNLFQNFVTKILQESLPNQYDVFKEEEKKYFLNNISSQNPKLDGITPFQTEAMKPDIIIKKNKKDILVIDTKYKENTTKSDYYQSISYSLYSKCPVLLLLPQIDEKKASDFQINQSILNVDAKIFVRTIDFESHSDQNYIKIMKNRILKTVYDIFEILGESPSQINDLNLLR